jgi:hypothetical protein
MKMAKTKKPKFGTILDKIDEHGYLKRPEDQVLWHITGSDSLFDPFLINTVVSNLISNRRPPNFTDPQPGGHVNYATGILYYSGMNPDSGLVVVHAALLINRHELDNMDTEGIIKTFQLRPEKIRLFAYTTESNHRDGTLFGSISQNGTSFESNAYDTQNTGGLPGYRRAILDTLINDPGFVKIGVPSLMESLDQVFAPLEKRLVEFYMAVAREYAKTRRE